MNTIKDSIKSYIDGYIPIYGNTYFTEAMIDYVRDALSRPRLRDGSILRKMRLLRNEGYDIECIDHQRSEYRVTMEYDDNGQGRFL